MTLQLEVGKSYATREGGTVTIIRNDGHRTYPFDGDNGCSYTLQGCECSDDTESEKDIIAESLSALRLCAGPGWQLRNGEVVTLRPRAPRDHSVDDIYVWFSDRGTGLAWSWTASGSYWGIGNSQNAKDIVGRDLTAVTPDQAEPPAIAPQPERVKILHEGAALTSGARDAEYGPPQINMNAAGRLKQLARELATRDICPAEWEALDMVLTKMSRLLVGTAKRDTYVDGAAYFAIAGEIALSI